MRQHAHSGGNLQEYLVRPFANVTIVEKVITAGEGVIAMTIIVIRCL